MKKGKVVKKIALVSILLGAVILTVLGMSSQKPVVAEGANGDTQAFINAIAPSAVEIANANDLYPSVMIAQAMLESNFGQSGLSANYNNLFGIKGAYNGSSVSLKTWEDDGQGNAYEIMDNFRSYPSWADSLADYARILSYGRYAGVHRSAAPTYADATAALTGTYATDTSYGAKLNYVIEKYNLTAFDNAGGLASPAGSSQGQTANASQVWNSYRGQYTSQEILDLDAAWAAHTAE